MPDHPYGPIGTRRRPPKERKDNGVTFSVYMSNDLLERLEAWRTRQYIPPSRAALLRQIIRDFLDREEST